MMKERRINRNTKVLRRREEIGIRESRCCLRGLRGLPSPLRSFKTSTWFVDHVMGKGEGFWVCGWPFATTAGMFDGCLWNWATRRTQGKKGECRGLYVVEGWGRSSAAVRGSSACACWWRLGVDWTWIDSLAAPASLHNPAIFSSRKHHKSRIQHQTGSTPSQLVSSEFCYNSNNRPYVVQAIISFLMVSIF